MLFHLLSLNYTGLCFAGQFTCGLGDKECYPRHKHCDYVWDCPLFGNDEKGCFECGPSEFACRGSNHCYNSQQRCDGIGHCGNENTDEENCSKRKKRPTSTHSSYIVFVSCDYSMFPVSLQLRSSVTTTTEHSCVPTATASASRTRATATTTVKTTVTRRIVSVSGVALRSMS